MVLINELIGSFGKYQLWLCFLVFLSKFGVAFHHMAIFFLAPPVSYYCPGSNVTCCDDPVYDTSLFKRTIIMEWNLICGRKWLADISQTLFQFGVLLGSLVLGIASDRYGRRLTLNISVVVEVVAGIIASFMPDFWAFTIARMILGFAVGGVMIIGYVIVMEYVGNNIRDLIAALFHVPFTLGNIILAFLGFLVRDYVYFQLTISMTTVILLCYICLLPETPRWYLAMNRVDDAVAVTTRVAKFNKLPIDEIPEKLQMYETEHGVKAQHGTFTDLFRKKNLRKNILTMSFLWFSCSFCFFGVSQYVSQLDGNIFINVAASGTLSLCGLIASIPMMKYLKRKTVVIVSNVACSLCLFIIAVSPKGIVSTMFGCIGVLFSFIVFVIVYLFCSEMFPTVVRNAALGICSVVARFGAMIAPFVANLKPHWCAPVVFGVIPLVAAALCYFLPETKDCELLATIEEAEEFGGRS